MASYWSTTSGATKILATAVPVDGDSVVFGGVNGTVLYSISTYPQLKDWKVETAGYIFRTGANSKIFSLESFSGAGLSSATFESGGNHAATFNIRGDTAFTGTIQDGSGTLSLTKTGSGTWDLSSATLTYTKGTVLNDGALKMTTSQINGLSGQVTAGNAANSGGSFVIVNGGTITRGLGTGNITLGATGNASSNTRAGFGAQGGNLTLNFGGSSAEVEWGMAGFRAEKFTLGTTDSTHTVTMTNDIKLNAEDRILRVENGAAAIDADVTGAISTSSAGRILTKEGTGTLRLSGTSSSSVCLNHTQGTILVDGSWTSSANNTDYGIEVASGATLGGDGSISLTSATLSVNGSLMAGRGGADQSLSIGGNVTLGGNSTLIFGIGAGDASDQIIRTGGAVWSFQSGQQVQLLLNGSLEGNFTYTLITGLASSVDVSGWSLVGTDPTVTGGFLYDSGSILFNAHVIPEPSALLLLGLGLLTLTSRRRNAVTEERR